jgi:hypothetical protein
MDMDTDDMLKDDFLADLIRNMPLESPSDEFVNKVMLGIGPFPAGAVEQSPFLLWIRSFLPYLGLGMIIVLILISSDIPYLNFINGKEYFSAAFLKIFSPFWTSMKTVVSSRFVTYFLLIGVSAGFLYIIDKLFSRRFAA